MADNVVTAVVGASWRTNLAGTIGMVAILLAAIKMGLSGDFSHIDFTQVMTAIGGLAVAFGLTQSRDDKVSSAQVPGNPEHTG